ncbi:MAG: serine protease [Terriglobia bacterium]
MVRHLMSITPRCRFLPTVLAIILVLGLVAFSAASQKDNPASDQLPPELRGAKVYHLPDKTEPGKPAEDPAIYKSISYADINYDRLLLNLFVAIKPVDRAATVRKIYFQDVRVGGIPVHLDTFDKEFKVSKKDPVDLPAPLRCSIVFTDLESLAPLKQLVDERQIRITGQSFIEVKLSSLEKLAVGGKQVVLPVQLNQQIPMQFLPDSPFMLTAAKQLIDTISNPTTSAAIALAKEHLAKLTQEHTLSMLAQSSLYLIYCEYALQNPKTHATEKFVQSGTGFVVSADGKLLTAKRVLQPWKFDPQVAFLMKTQHLELVDKSYKLAAWPAGAQVVSPDGGFNFQAARSSDQQTLKVLKTAPDQMTKQNYQDPDSDAAAVLDLHAEGANDLAVLQISGAGFQPLALADSPATAGGQPAALVSFPYGLSQPLAVPKLTFVKAPTGTEISLDQPLNAGESGAPLMGPEGKVVALAGDAHECITAEALRRVIQ